MRLHTFIFALLVLGGCILCIVGQPRQIPDQTAIYALVREGKCAEAVVKIDDILMHSNQKAELTAVKAGCQATLGQPIQSFENALIALRDPELGKGTFVRAHGLLFQLGKYEEALRIASDFIDRKQFLFEAYNRRSAVYSRLGKYELAVEDMIRASRDFPGEPFLNRVSLIVLEELPATDERRARLYRLVFNEIKPLHDRAISQRDSIPAGELVHPHISNAIQTTTATLFIAASEEAKMYDSRGMTVEAEGVYERIVTVEPRSMAYRLRAVFYRKKGFDDKANESTRLMNYYLAKEYTREIELRKSADPKQLSQMYLFRGKYFHLAASHELARADFELALELNPELKKRVKEILLEKLD